MGLDGVGWGRMWLDRMGWGWVGLDGVRWGERDKVEYGRGPVRYGQDGRCVVGLDGKEWDWVGWSAVGVRWHLKETLRMQQSRGSNQGEPEDGPGRHMDGAMLVVLARVGWRAGGVAWST